MCSLAKEARGQHK